MDRLMINANMSDCTTVAENCQGASVMSVNNTVNCSYAYEAYEGTPDGVSFFAFTRFIGYAFYYYFKALKNCSSALFKGVKESYAAA